MILEVVIIDIHSNSVDRSFWILGKFKIDSVQKGFGLKSY